MVVKSERDQQSHAEPPQQPGVGEKVRVNHQRQPDRFRLPKLQPAPIGKGPPANGPEDEAGEQVVRIEAEVHLFNPP